MESSIYIFLSVFISVSFLITIWIFLKISLKLEKRISRIEKYVLEVLDDIDDKQINDKNSSSIDLVKGLQQVKKDDERHLKLLEMGRQLQTPLKIMNQNSIQDRGFNTGGDLIPHNLTKEEEEILRMYYDRSNER